MKRIFLFSSALCAALCEAAVVTPAVREDIRLNGPVAVRLEACVKNHLEATDPLYLTKFFHSRQQSWMWQSEFWGKWMHAAAPFADYCDSATLKRNVAKGLQDILSTQDADGYIGNYPESKRYAAECWDVWGTKYTLLGLLHAYDSSKDPATLAAAERLAGKLMDVFGPGKRALHESGWYRGMPSCSVLEPIVWLYKRTNKAAYLAFAKYIVSEADHPEGARLLRDADKPVFARVTQDALHSSLKAYEMMSCYQGMLELFDVTGDRTLLDAAVKTANHIRAEEINLVGGAATGEHWYRGASHETESYNRQNETCVLTTWMRFCRKLWEETGDRVWIDELERTFYNAYLGTMRPDGSCFTQYCPLAGTRSSGEHHCRTYTNCCNANGPRGFLDFLDAYAGVAGSTVYLNLYASGFFAVNVPAFQGKVDFQVYTEYPRTGSVTLWYRSAVARDFTLDLRKPGWCGEMSVRVNGKQAGPILARMWQPGDEVEIVFAMPVVSHVKADCIAFTRGPVVLARDRRLGGDPSAVIRRTFYLDGSGETEVPDITKIKFDFTQVRTNNRDIWMRFVGILPTETHSESTEAGYPEAVGFCDFASAGNTWTDDSSYRVWLPILKFEAHR